MAEDKESYFKRNWKLILNLVTLVALIVLVWAVRDQIVDTIKNLSNVNAWALLLLIPIQIVNYHAQTRMYQGMFRVVGDRLRYKYLYKLSLELNFVNHVFPSGGVSGISYFGLRLKRDGIGGTKATLVQLMKLVLTFTSFEVLLLLGMLILSAVGKASNEIIFIGTAITMMVIMGTGIGAYVAGDRHRVQAFFTTLTRFLNHLIRVVRPKHPETINLTSARQAFDEIHDNYRLFRTRLHELERPFLWALVANVTEILSVYVVFVAFGHWENVGAIILAYAVANFAGLISVLPGGVGVYEALMTAVLVAGGVPAGISISATVMYRILNTLIQVPPGYYLYHKNLHRSTPDPDARELEPEPEVIAPVKN